MSGANEDRRNTKRSDRRDQLAELERTLPHNLEAERAVLGAILLHNDAYIHAARYIQPHDFFRDAHKRIYLGISRLLDQPNGVVDLVGLKNELGRRGDLDDVGGAAYISSLTDGVPRSTNVAEYARIVREKGLLREMIYLSNKILTDAYAAEDSAADILNAADQQIVTLQHGQSQGRMRPLSASSGDILDRLQWRLAHQGELTGIETGFRSVNDGTYGWQRGDLIIIAARPSMGKTALTINMASAAALTPRPDGSKSHVALFSLEMRRNQLEDRLLSALSGVPLSSIMGGWLYDQHWGPLATAIGQMHEMNLHIDDAAHQTVHNIRAECRRMRSEHGLDLAIVDYVQLVTGTVARRDATRTEELTDISRRLKILADEISAPIIVLSQLRRTQGARPTLEDLRESGALEQDADLVCFLHRKDHRVGGPCEFIIAKQRNGPTATMNLSFDRDIQRFEDVGAATAEQEQAASHEDDQRAKTRRIIQHKARIANNPRKDVD